MTAKPRKSRMNPAIFDYIVHNLMRGVDIATKTRSRFGISRATVNRYLDKLVADGVLEASGQTKARTYKLSYFINECQTLSVTPDLQEHIVFRQVVAPLLEGVSQNAFEICEYGVSEMVNNVKDHSEGKTLFIGLKRSARLIRIFIEDDGVGIFDKIARECNLNDPRESILELAKGKLTTDPAHHTGEGIFFTSRMCRHFAIFSGALVYDHEMQDDEDFLFEEDEPDKIVKGTQVAITLDAAPSYTVREIFKQYEEDVDGYAAFRKTHVPVQLALYGNEQLVSRSQARRVLARFNKFSEVMLDFKNVPRIGQSFADEIFRVFRKEHPEVRIVPIRMSDEVRDVIKRAAANGGIGSADGTSSQTPAG